jgi:UDP-N-acetylglucosamine acyltransferase
MASIHPTAVVEPRARIASDVSIGPLCVIEANVTIERGCRIASHAIIKSGTSLGQNNTISEGAVLGGRPQHLQAGERVGRLQIGSGNTVRENTTIHAAVKEDDWTIVGDNNLIMVNAHIGHDCRIGSNTIIANNAMIAGHVVVEDRVYISGAAGIHQFCRIGQLAMVGGQSHIRRDVLPYVMLDGQTSHVVGLNVIGLRRAGFSDKDILQLKAAYRYIYRSGLPWNEILEGLPSEFPDGPASVYHEFLRRGKRGIMQDRRGPVRSTLRIFPNDDEAAEADKNVRTAG